MTRATPSELFYRALELRERHRKEISSLNEPERTKALQNEGATLECLLQNIVLLELESRLTENQFGESPVVEQEIMLDSDLVSEVLEALQCSYQGREHYLLRKRVKRAAGLSPEVRRCIEIAVWYCHLCKTKQLTDKKWRRTVSVLFGVTRKAVGKWIQTIEVPGDLPLDLGDSTGEQEWAICQLQTASDLYRLYRSPKSVERIE